MGNLLACFGAPKKGDRRRPSPHEQHARERYRSLRTSPAPYAPPTQRMAPECTSTGQCVPHEREENGFDGGNGQSSSDDGGVDKKQPKAATGSPKKKVTFDMNVQTYESAMVHPGEDEDAESCDEEAKIPGPPVFPPNHRYQGCPSSDDEDSEDDDDLYNVTEEDDDDCGDLNREEELEEEEEESFSSYFSKRLGRDTRESGQGPQLTMYEKARDQSYEVLRPVLNPVENLSPWREVKAAGKATPPRLATKENVCVNLDLCAGNREVSVDTSLSSWLTPPRRSNVHGKDEREGSGSCRSRSNASASMDDRPILGALTIDDLKRAATSSPSPSPRKSPSRSPEETPIVGTVGQYWSLHDTSPGSAAKGIPNTTSKYSEDKRVQWRSTPFEVRLERALSKGSTDVVVA